MTPFVLLLVFSVDPLTMIVTGTETFRAPIVAPRVEIVGQGFNGTDPTGPVLLFDVGVGDGIRLGKGDPFRATGTRIENCRVSRQGSGGTGIAIDAISTAERPGELVIRDILVCGYSDLRGGATHDHWDCGLRIDGGNLTATNAAGIRRIRIDNFRVASALGDSIVLRNVTHVTGTGIQIDKGTSPRPVPTMVVENSRHVDIGVNLFGELHIRGSEVVMVSGYAQTVYINRACKMVTLRGVFPRVVSEGNPVLKNQSNFTRW